jgi:hypothetical protein
MASSVALVTTCSIQAHTAEGRTGNFFTPQMWWTGGENSEPKELMKKDVAPGERKSSNGRADASMIEHRKDPAILHIPH